MILSTSLPASGDRLPAILKRIAGHARMTGDSPALSCGDVILSYGDLWTAAEGVAEALVRQGVHPGDRVAIAGDRSAADFVSVLAILHAGATFVPLGSNPPLQRAQAIVDDAGAALLLAGPSARDLAQALGYRLTLSLESAGDTILLFSRPAGPVQLSVPSGLSAGYILFTSGSTGRPKGVPIGIDQVAAYIDNLQATYPVDRNDRCCQLAELSFDASVHEMFQAWSAGALLVTIPARQALMWPRYVHDRALSTILLVPSQVRLAAQTRALRAGALPALRRAFLGAETVTTESVALMRAAAPNAMLVNLWGPTEATVAMTHHEIDEAGGGSEGTANASGDIPIGHPWKRGTVRLELPDGSIPHDGCEGELLLSGAQISAGYWNAPAQTLACFVERDGHRWYRSGDMATWDPKSGYRFVGRRDRQVKIKGHRIELEDCERSIAALAKCDVAIIAVTSTAGEPRLTAFVTCDDVKLATLRDEMSSALPPTMVPSRLIQLATLPRTASRKVDLAALATLVEREE